MIQLVRVTMTSGKFCCPFWWKMFGWQPISSHPPNRCFWTANKLLKITKSVTNSTAAFIFWTHFNWRQWSCGARATISCLFLLPRPFHHTRTIFILLLQTLSTAQITSAFYPEAITSSNCYHLQSKYIRRMCDWILKDNHNWKRHVYEIWPMEKYQFWQETFQVSNLFIIA